jgi:hypothetical protein
MRRKWKTHRRNTVEGLRFDSVVLLFNFAFVLAAFDALLRERAWRGSTCGAGRWGLWFRVRAGGLE